MVDKLGIGGRDGRWAKQWVVESQSGPGVYTVSLDHDGNYACSCPGWTRHMPRMDCKHILEVRSGGGKSYTEAVIDRMKG